jgi:hypothetical protein
MLLAMPDINPTFLLDNPELVTPAAPWCVRLDNLELGTLLLAQPWVAGGGIGRADLERQLSHLAKDLPLGPVYFQRVNRAVAKLEEMEAMRGRGSGRSRRFVLTPRGFAALILNLRVLVTDPTVDGSEFELKRALVAMCNLVLERVSELPGEVPLDPEMDRFFDEAEGLTVLGHRVITDEIVSQALDILGLVEIQRQRILHLLEVAVDRLEQLSAHADVLGGVDLAHLPESIAPGDATPLADDPATTGMVRSLATHALPQLSLRATILRYRSYLDYLDRLTRLYSRELKVMDIGTLRQLTGRRGA